VVVCEQNIPIGIKNRRSGQWLKTSGVNLLLSDKDPHAFWLNTTLSYVSTVQIVSSGAVNNSITDMQGVPRMNASKVSSDPQSWWITEVPGSDGKAVYLTSYLAGSLRADERGGVMMDAKKADDSEWEITKRNGHNACTLVEPTTAIITLPGAWRESEWHQHDMGRVLKHRERQAGDTVVISVDFGDKPCSATQWNPNLPGTGYTPLWKKDYQWIYGSNPDDDRGPTSIEALDKVVEWIGTNYKAVKLLNVAGFSAGGVIGLRWAILSPVGVDGVYHKIGGGKIQVRTIVGGLGSYEYFNRKRPALHCIADHWPHKNTTPCHTCDEFLLPEAGARRRGKHVPQTCSGSWDKFPYGNEDLAKLKQFSMLAQYIKKDFQNSPEFDAIDSNGKPFWKEFPEEVKLRFKSKDVRFMLGGHDMVTCVGKVCQCGMGCDEKIQGSNRLQRALNYMSHLQEALPGYMPIYGVYMNPDYYHHYHYGAWMSHHFESWVFLERPNRVETPIRTGPAQAWLKTAGKKCWREGGKPLMTIPDQCHTVETCQKKCSADLYCKGIGMRQDLSGGDCWMFSDVDLQNCDDDSDFNMYLIHHSTTTTTTTTTPAPTTTTQKASTTHARKEPVTTKAARKEAVTSKAAHKEAVTTKAANKEAVTTKAAPTEAVTSKAAHKEAVTSKAAHKEAVTTKAAHKEEAVTTKAAPAAAPKPLPLPLVKALPQIASAAPFLLSSASLPVTAAVEAGARTLHVANHAGFQIGDVIQIGAEVTKIVGFGSIIVDPPLKGSYPAGTSIVKIPPAEDLQKLWICVGSTLLVIVLCFSCCFWALVCCCCCSAGTAAAATSKGEARPLLAARLEEGQVPDTGSDTTTDKGT